MQQRASRLPPLRLGDHVVDIQHLAVHRVWVASVELVGVSGHSNWKVGLHWKIRLCFDKSEELEALLPVLLSVHRIA